LLLEQHIPSVLASIAHSYIIPATYDDYEIASIGHGELCIDITNINYGLYGANDWNNGLYSACCGGHREIVDMMIAHGANCWDDGLYGACRYGHYDIANLMIAHGGNDWNEGLFGACMSVGIVKLST
jgi:hypothetical protein